MNEWWLFEWKKSAIVDCSWVIYLNLVRHIFSFITIAPQIPKFLLFHLTEFQCLHLSLSLSHRTPVGHPKSTESIGWNTIDSMLHNGFFQPIKRQTGYDSPFVAYNQFHNGWENGTLFLMMSLSLWESVVCHFFSINVIVFVHHVDVSIFNLALSIH